jgi:hypothetical protein
VYRLLRVSPSAKTDRSTTCVTMTYDIRGLTNFFNNSAYKECKKNWVSHCSHWPNTLIGLSRRGRVLTKRATDGGNERREAQERQTLVLSLPIRPSDVTAAIIYLSTRKTAPEERVSINKRVRYMCIVESSSFYSRVTVWILSRSRKSPPPYELWKIGNTMRECGLESELLASESKGGLSL